MTNLIFFKIKILIPLGESYYEVIYFKGETTYLCFLDKHLNYFERIE